MSEFFREGPADSFAERDKIAVGAGTVDARRPQFLTERNGKYIGAASKCTAN